MKLFRYINLFKNFFKFSFQTEVEFRSNLIFWSLENLLWLGFAMTGVNLIFSNVNTIAYWTKNEAMLVVLTSSLFADLCWTFIFQNLANFSYLVRRGELDNILLKPVNLRFILSFRYLEFDHYIRMFLAIYLIRKYLLMMGTPITIFNILNYLFLLLCSFLIFYSIYFMLTTINFWFVKINNLLDVFQNIRDISKQPVYIFKEKALFFFSFILPVGFMATFPVEALLGKIDYSKLAIAPFLVIFFFILSQKFFNYALKYYSSASS